MISYFAVFPVQNKESCSKIISRYFTLVHQWKPRLRFQWRGKLYQFLCLCFGMGPAPRVFKKLMKVPIALLRKLNIRLIIYLDDILILTSDLKEIEMARDTVIFLLTHLGFTINFQKSVVQPTQKIQFLGVEVDSLSLKLSPPREKVELIVSQCKTLLAATEDRSDSEGCHTIGGSSLLGSYSSSSDSQQRIDKSKQTDLGISIATSDHNYCRIPSRNSKCRGGRNVQECEGLQRVEIEQTSISKDLQSKGNPLHRLVCFEVVSSSSPIFFMEDRSLQPGSGCTTGMLESSKRVCISPLFFNREGSLESSHRSGHNYSDNTSLVSTTIKAFNEKSNPSSKITGSLEKPTGGIPFSRKKSKLATSGLDSVRKN